MAQVTTAEIVQILNTASPKLDDALSHIDDAYRLLDNASRSEEHQELLLEINGLRDEFTSVQSTLQMLIETYGDE